MKIGIGIAGAGFIGGAHAQILSKDDRVKLVGFYDADKARAKSLSEKYGAKVFQTYENLIEDPDVNVVYLTLPNVYHAKSALDAIKKSIHVFSEKPPATDLDDAKKILKAVKKAGIVYQVGFNRRFCPVYKKVKELLKKDTIAHLANMKMVRGELMRPSWVGDPKISGGFLYETPIHILDLARWFFGEVSEVNCWAKSNVYKNQLDDFVILIRFEGDRFASVVSSAHASWVFPFERIEIFGDHSSIITQEMDEVIYSPGLEKPIVSWNFSRLPREEAWGYVEEDRLFVGAVIGKGKNYVDANEGFKAVEIVEACYKSAKERGLVKLPLKGR